MQSPIEHVFIHNHCYLRQVRSSILDIHLFKSLLLDQPESCHGINLMSLASTGLHQLDAWSPWKLSSTANFCSCFWCIRSLSNSMISINLASTWCHMGDDMASTWCTVSLEVQQHSSFSSCFCFWPLSLAPTWCGCHGINFDLLWP